MKVDVRNMLAGCPDACQNADAAVDYDSINAVFSGLIAVVIEVKCSHMETCKYRGGEEDGQ